MKETLDNLWYSHLIENPIKRTREEQKIIEILEKSEKDLHQRLNEEEIKILEHYENNLAALNCIAEEKAFAKGISFATRYLIEAISIE